MERNQNQRQTPGSSPGSSPRRDEVPPYYRPPEKKEVTTSGFNKILLGGLLLAFIGGGGLIASRFLTSGSGGEEISKASDHRRELVQSILALRDEDYHPDKLPALKKALKLKYPEARVEIQEKASSVDLTEKSIPTQEEHQHHHDVAPRDIEQGNLEVERNNALASESLIMQLSEDTIAREEKAEAEIRKLRDEQRRRVEMAQSQHNQSHPDHAGELGLYKGILTKCYIHGHDVHFVTEFGMIIQHVEKDDILYGRAMEARGIINSNDGRVVVVLYENGIQVFDSMGTLLRSK
jgi:hypothetical protein